MSKQGRATHINNQGLDLVAAVRDYCRLQVATWREVGQLTGKRYLSITGATVAIDLDTGELVWMYGGAQGETIMAQDQDVMQLALSLGLLDAAAYIEGEAPRR